MNHPAPGPSRQLLRAACLILLCISWTHVRCQDSRATSREPSQMREAYLYPFRSPASGKIGYIDSKGQVAIPPQFTDCNGINPGPEFSGGRVLVGCAPVGYADATGKQLIAGQFDDGRPFSQNLAAIKHENGQWGYINSDGIISVSPRFAEAGNFAEGLAPVSNENGAWGYIDPQGRKKISFSFQHAGVFSNGLAPVQVEGKSGYIEKSGKLVIPAKFQDAKPFSEGLAAVLTDSWHYINAEGNSIFPETYDQAGDFSEGLAPVQPKGGKSFGYINREGAWSIKPQFDKANPFHHGLALVYFKTEHVPGSEKRLLRYGYIDKSGRTVFSSQLAYVQGGARGSEPVFYLPMITVNIESLPTGAKVYLIPLDDWESEPDLVNQKEKMLKYLLNGYTPLRDYKVIEQVYRVLIDLNGKKVSRQFDVNQSSSRLQVDFEKE